MAVYTKNTNSLQEAALTAHRLTLNAERAAAVPPLPPFDDNASMVDFLIDNQMLGPTVQAFIERRLQQIANAYRTATNAQRAAADTALGI
jgi:hypothetical protein